MTSMLLLDVDTCSLVALHPLINKSRDAPARYARKGRLAIQPRRQRNVLVDAGLLDFPEPTEPEAVRASEHDAFICPVPGLMKQSFLAVTTHPVGVADERTLMRKPSGASRH